MVITLTPENEAKLWERAERVGQDPQRVVNMLLAAALEWEARDRAEAIAGIQRGLEASAAGRVRPVEEVLADLKSRWLFERGLA